MALTSGRPYYNQGSMKVIFMVKRKFSAFQSERSINSMEKIWAMEVQNRIFVGGHRSVDH